MQGEDGLEIKLMLQSSTNAWCELGFLSFISCDLLPQLLTGTHTQMPGGYELHLAGPAGP